MTYREKLSIDHPDCIGDQYPGGCKGCPQNYGYEDFSICCGNGCDDCWSREMEKKEMAEMEDMAVCESCEVKSYPTVKEINRSNYGLIKELESTLNIIAMEVKKTDVPEFNDAFPLDLIDGFLEQNRLLGRCLDHARYIKYHLGIGDM